MQLDRHLDNQGHTREEKIPRGQSNTKRQRKYTNHDKRQRDIKKTLHRKLNVEQHEPNQNILTESVVSKKISAFSQFFVTQ